MKLTNEATGETEEWFFTGDLAAYLVEQLGDADRLPDEPFTGHFQGGHETADWAFCWMPGIEASVAESYVNLIPTPQGGTHVNGLRSGVDRCGARILRIPEPGAARPQARARGRLARRSASCCRCA